LEIPENRKKISVKARNPGIPGLVALPVSRDPFNREIWKHYYNMLDIRSKIIYSQALLSFEINFLKVTLRLHNDSAKKSCKHEQQTFHNLVNVL
jgi:hypothetical protein